MNYKDLFAINKVKEKYGSFTFKRAMLHIISYGRIAFLNTACINEIQKAADKKYDEIKKEDEKFAPVVIGIENKAVECAIELAQFSSKTLYLYLIQRKEIEHCVKEARKRK